MMRRRIGTGHKRYKVRVESIRLGQGEHREHAMIAAASEPYQ